MDIKAILEKYDKNNITIAVLGSHSALDVCRGAKDLGFKTLVITEKGRGETYKTYYKTQGEIGCVDEVIELDKFKDILKPEVQAELVKRSSIFIPHRSFEVYINDYDAIENEFKVPMFGNRKLLRTEERGFKDRIDQYKIMKKAGIRYPRQIDHPYHIDTLCIVKVLDKQRGFERANFLAKDYTEYIKKKKRGIKRGDFTEEQLDKAVIEEFILGVQVNFNFFYDPIYDRLELIGTDTRRQTNHEGVYRLSPDYQKLYERINGKISYEEASHVAVTVLESMLESAFDLGDKFVKACKELVAPGVIGPFGLQSFIIPEEKRKEIIVFDVSPRMPGSPGISSTPYSGYLYGQSISAGKRVAMEIRQAVDENKLEQVLT